MRFFIPGITDPVKVARVYEGIVLFAKETLGWPINTEQKIYKIEYTHAGKRYVAKVGERGTCNGRAEGEDIFAILDSNAYLVCTLNKGVARGVPILVRKSDVVNVEYFVNAAMALFREDSQG